VRVAERLAPDPFGATVNPKLPLPEPPLPTFSHAALETGVQEQPSGADTLTVPLPPDLKNITVLDEIETRQAEPLCVMFTLLPATSIDADRPSDEGLAATVKPALAVPTPTPPVTTHGAEDTGVQAHPLSAVTLILPVPPAAENAVALAETE
jgi:hypothetical protein